MKGYKNTIDKSVNIRYNSITEDNKIYEREMVLNEQQLK